MLRTQAQVLEEARPASVVHRQPPEFPGGDEALNKWVKTEVDSVFMARLLDTDLNGRVLIACTITAEGGVDSVSLERGVCPAYDVEALRLVRSMPNWIPGKIDGVPQPMRMMIPITFRHE